jgi:phosphate transport system ATP-binding protein
MKEHHADITGLLQQVAVQNNQEPCIQIRQFNAWFGRIQVLKNINLQFNRHQINCIIGPSGSGKSTLIRSINRINDDISSFKCQGEILFNGNNIFADRNVTAIRKQLGMVFQKPCVFPNSIRENVLFGLQFNKVLSQQQRQTVLENKLKAVALWGEVKQRLDAPATELSLGQQQRLCIARTLAVDPQVLLLDEPTSSLGPVSNRAIEDLMLQLKDRYTIIFVTHNILQAKRIADRLIFMCDTQVIEQGDKERLFKNPAQQQTWDYLNNEYCFC